MSTSNRFPNYYQERFYAYHTIARGLLTVDQLKNAFEPLSRQYWHKLRSYLPANKSQMCLDLPCGFGNFLYFMKKYGYDNCRGYDLDPRQVELAQSLGLEASVADAFDVLANLPEVPSLIASIDFLEHLDKSTAIRFLDACYNSLPAGGTLILRTPSADGPFGAHDLYNDITHEWGVTSNSLRCLLNMVGFTTVRVLDTPDCHATGGVERAVRLAACRIARWAVGLLFRIMCLGLPSVWERSMWVIATK